jgi:hypothetical protein
LSPPTGDRSIFGGRGRAGPSATTIRDFDAAAVQVADPAAWCGVLRT